MGGTLSLFCLIVATWCFLLNHFGTFASGCCNWYCSVTQAHLPVIVAIDCGFLIWHNCLFCLEVNFTSHSGTFASGCCNFICSLDLAQLPSVIWHICQLLFQQTFGLFSWHTCHLSSLFGIWLIPSSTITYGILCFLVLHRLQFYFLFLCTAISGCHPFLVFFSVNLYENGAKATYITKGSKAHGKREGGWTSSQARTWKEMSCCIS